MYVSLKFIIKISSKEGNLTGTMYYRCRVIGRRDEDDRGGGRGQNGAHRLQIRQRVALLALQVDDRLDRRALVGDARPEPNDA